MKSSLNVYIFEEIIKKIKSGYYEIGDKIPTENEMEKIYGVSRSPIRQALGLLQSEGYIQRNPGIGSVIVNNNESAPIPSSGGFRWNLNKKWKDLNCKTISVEKIISDDEDILTKLSKEGDIVIQIKRVRSEALKPIFLLTNYYKEKDVDINVIKEAGDIVNMRNFAKKKLGLKVSYANEEIKAIKATKEISYYLQVEVGHPLLQIKRVSYDFNYNPVEYVVYHVDSTNWPYMVIYDEAQN